MARGSRIPQLLGCATAVFGVLSILGVLAVSIVPAYAVHERAEQLFDIRLSLEKNEVDRVQDLVARADFVSFGRVPTKVDLQYSIEDTGGTVVFEANTETIIVETELNYPHRFLDAKSLPDGAYVLKLRTRYGDNITDIFTQAFMIKSESGLPNVALIILGIFSVGVVVWFLYLLAHTKGKVAHDRMGAVTTMVMILLVAGVIFPTMAQLINTQSDAYRKTQANLWGSLLLHTKTDISTFVAYNESAQQVFDAVSQNIISLDDDTLLTFVAEHAVIDAVHAIDARGVALTSAFRNTHFIPSVAVAVPPLTDGIFKRVDGTWRVVASFPRMAGGVYLLEVSIQDNITDILRLERAQEGMLVVDAQGVVLVGGSRYPTGINLFKEYVHVFEKGIGQSYYEGIGDGHAFVLQKVFIPSSHDKKFIYLISFTQDISGSLRGFAF